MPRARAFTTPRHPLTVPAGRLNAVHPHFRHDFEPDATEAALVRQDAPLPAQRIYWTLKCDPANWRNLTPDEPDIIHGLRSPNTFRTRRRVKPL